MADGSGSGVLRLLNGQRIVDALFAAHPTRISRAGIARATGLSKPTVSALVADMESAGLVRVSDESPSLGSIGRPAALYELVPTARHSLAADIGATKVLVGVSDLFGALIAEREFTAGPDARTTLNRLTAAAAELLRGIADGCQAVCVGVPGIYRPDRDRVEQALNLPGFEDLALHSWLAERFDARVHVENDVNLAALGELTQMGDEPSAGDFAAVSVGTGIGLGMVVGGDLYRGGTGSAGELGSLLLSAPRAGVAPVTLEDAASAPRIRKRFGQAIEDGCRSRLDADADLPEIFEAATTGDEAATRVLDEAATAMALAVSHLCLIADPTRIVFGGGVGANPVFVEAVGDRLRRLVAEPPELTASTLGRRAALIGAVSMSLRLIHESLVVEILGDQQ
ncbi:MAG: ROK family transcriptional regulator [Acidimicrobiaceae bacterium]|nr:ROK family transcriptional regulator [Acidimicrobiaceae bacterium]MCY4280593.1 ROK family transcriptional regulator [Acidimicrobiaceae bacterium]MCY4293337.1 ROK family transcriptional regulator [Acidimicrobiaceae bacterium]